MLTKEDLIAFEKDIEQYWLTGKVKAPIHFAGSKDGLYEEELITIFGQVGPEDWVCSTHRSHYHALLKGVPPELVKKEILAGNSMHLNFKNYKFITSSIVAGIIPIALGIALGIKLRGGLEKVWCFLGDMAVSTGLFYESKTYANRNNLPISFISENNGFSVCTPTEECWGKEICREHIDYEITYKRTYPHSGVEGVWVKF